MLWNQIVNRFKNRFGGEKKQIIDRMKTPIFLGQVIASTAFLVIAYFSFETIVDWFFETTEDRRNLILTIAGLIGLHFLYRRTRAIEQTARTAEQDLTVDRLTRSTEQLTHDKTSIRLSGILGLEQIALSREEECKKIIQILSAFIREIAPLDRTRKEEERHNHVDIETAVNALANIAAPFKSQKCLFCDLQETNLSGLRFFDTDLSFFTLTGADISNAVFFNVNFEGTELNGANISNASFEDAIGEPWESPKKSFYWKGQRPDTLPDGLEPEEREPEEENT